jgi:hypothetical protein
MSTVAPSPSSSGGVIPARLGFLAIFNPTLGNTDKTLDDQIVYYASVNTLSQRRRHRSRGRPAGKISQEERNERLRQIGLAQGMIEFSKGFSGGRPVDTIDTEKSRVVLHELESGWWILAVSRADHLLVSSYRAIQLLIVNFVKQSIDLTRLPLPPKLVTSKTAGGVDENVEYTSREIKPACLLMQDLLRAHSTFLLHHNPSLSALFIRSKRSKFVSLLGRYWDLFLSTWNVMLHGNPTRNAFGGINMAASGELGIGVGEEERGSGEREVLEGLVGRVEGLVDLLVSRFGTVEEDQSPKTAKTLATPSSEEWLGTGREPGSEDGAIFLGVGALSRKSIRDVTDWMEDMYTWGENAYGVIDSPNSLRQTARAAKSGPRASKGEGTKSKDPQLGKLPKYEIADTTKAQQPVDQETSTAEANAEGATRESETASNIEEPKDTEERPMDKLVSYLKLGYGTYWSLTPSAEGSTAEEAQTQAQAQGAETTTLSEPPTKRNESSLSSQGKGPADDALGHFLIGLMGDVEETVQSSDRGEAGESEDASDSEYNSRTLLRTVHVELESEAQDLPEAKVVRDLGHLVNDVTPIVGSPAPTASPFGSQDRNKARKLRVVVYVNKPFIFTFLFQLSTDSLAWDGFYRSLHYQLAPLRKPLLASTAFRPERPDTGSFAANIYDLMWDQSTLTVHSTLPNIPDTSQSQQLNPIPRAAWSRTEAINTHVQMLNIFAATRVDFSELERTCKTSRGWWVVWTRIVDRPVSRRPSLQEREDEDDDFNYDSTDYRARRSTASDSGESSTARPNKYSGDVVTPNAYKDIFLIRRASDHAGFRGVSSSYAESGIGWPDGTGRLAQGIGVDTRKYIEALLSLG